MWRDDPASVRPMLASTGTAPLESVALVYEPKYDGIRAIVAITPAHPHSGPASRRAGRTHRAAPSDVRIWSRLGNEKTAQFPEIVRALQQWGRPLTQPLVLDGEIVALDARGEATGFQQLQGRIHLRAGADGPLRSKRATWARTADDTAPSAVALILFDLLREGDDDLRARPLRERRARLEALFAERHAPLIRLSEQAVADGRALYGRAEAHGWEGLIAKRLDSAYRSGRRSPDWCKLKLVRRQTCVVGGWTAPRGSRPFFGALLLGVYDEAGHLQYVGHTGAGFSDAELGRVWQQLQPLRIRSSPFAVTPKTNERPYWVEPHLVAEVKFTEWTADGRLRHPTYIGLRDDIRPESVRREPDVVVRGQGEHMTSHPPYPPLTKATVAKLLDRLDAIQDAGGDGVLDLPGGDRLQVTNLGKIFWPARPRRGQRAALTKGDLFRHYVRVAPYLLPVLADRPLVMKRYPNGIAARPFYQHRAPSSHPPGVRVEPVGTGTETRPHVVGGSLVTLLYTVQLASISQDPWFSRVGSEDMVDHVAIDLDPPEGLPCSRVRDVARWVHDELQSLGAPGFAKTSGARGLHVYVPMPPGTSYEAGLLFCQIVATVVAKKHPRLATVERSLSARGQRVYVDYLQNVRGKTLASAYSARATDVAGVSTPVTWEEIEAGVSPGDFTIRNFADRLAAAGDLWAALRTSRPANLRAVMKYAEP